MKIIRIGLVFICLFFINGKSDIIKARAYLAKGSYDKAKQIYEEELKKSLKEDLLFPLSICYQKKGEIFDFGNISYSPHLRNGLFFYHKGDYKRAYNAFKLDKILYSYERTPYSYVGMGMVRKAQGNFKEAEKLFKKAKEIDPSLVLPYINLAKLYSLLENYHSLIEVLNEGIENTQSSELKFEFAKYLNASRRHKEALELLIILQDEEQDNILIKEEIVKACVFLGSPTLSFVILQDEATSLYLESCVDILGKKYIRAARLLDECVKKDKEFHLAKIRALWLCKELMWKNKLDEVYKDASSNFPSDGIPDVYMSEFWAKKGSYTTAFDYAKNAIEKEPSLNLGYFALGNIYYFTNDFIYAISSYKKGINLSDTKRPFWFFLEEAFLLRYLPIFLFGYSVCWLITLFLLLIIHLIGMFLIKDYPGLKRYVLKKRWFLWFYLATTLILALSMIFGQRTIKFVPIELLKDAFVFLVLYLPIGISLVLVLAVVLSFFIKWPKFRIYLSFILLDLSLDIGIIVLISSLLPIFADHPRVFNIVNLIFVILFRRSRLILICFLILFFHIWFQYFVSSGYKKVLIGRLNEGEKIFRKAISSIFFLKWLEPTYSDMVGLCILGRVLVLLKNGEYSKIEELWSPIEKNMDAWWPLNSRVRFLYQWSNSLSLILEGNKHDPSFLLEIPEYKKRKKAVYLLKSLTDKSYIPKYKEEKEKDRFISSALLYIEKNYLQI
ncbi:TPA: hypothetical protein DCX16_02460 [bacterium]|nr:hypothetical protein [bacterium]